jgi:hypothetical protein
MRPNQILAWIGLAMGLAVLGFELRLEVGRHSGDAALFAAGLRYLSFFTNLSNLAVVLVYAAALAPAQRRPAWLASPLPRATVLAMILLTMLVYYFVLARTENPQGWAKVSSVAAHYIAPLLYLAWWTVYARTGTLGLRDVPLMLVAPTVYMVLVLALGYVTGRYPYAMLDTVRHGDGGVALHGLGLLLLLVLLCLAVVGLDRLKARHPPVAMRLLGR